MLNTHAGNLVELRDFVTVHNDNIQELTKRIKDHETRLNDTDAHVNVVHSNWTAMSAQITQLFSNITEETQGRQLAINAASMGIAPLRTLGKFATNGMARETVAGPRRK